MRKTTFWNWLPALLTMAIIFWVSSQPSVELPNFGWADGFIKKSSHAVGYAVLTYCYWHGLGRKAGKRGQAWLLAILYACSDEYHQSFVPGRNASVWDVLIFDNIGALISLWMAGKYVEQKRSSESARSLPDD